MAKNKKDRSGKRHVPRDRNQVKLKYEPWRLKAVFDPLNGILDQLEQEHTVTIAGEHDQPVFMDLGTGQWHDTPAALLGFIDLFEIFELRFGQALPLEPLRVLHRKLSHGDLIDNHDTRAVRDAVAVLHGACLGITVAQADELVRDYRIKEEIEARKMS